MKDENKEENLRLSTRRWGTGINECKQYLKF